MALDTQLFYFFNSFAGQSPLFDRVIVLLASDLAYLLVILFLALVYFSSSSRREKLQLLWVTAVSALIARFGIVELIRLYYHRPRPFTALPVEQLLANDAWSFPSGHAAFFFAVATAVYLHNTRWGIGFFIAAGLMTLARVAAGIHYPSDILGGAAIGATVACTVYYFARRMRERDTD